MDSRIATYEHINVVRKLLMKVITVFLHRQEKHDQSKLKSPEVEVFDEYTSKLATSTYGSSEYKIFLSEMQPALDHHYANNDHHPEYGGLHICIQCGLDDRIQACSCGGPKRADIEHMNLISLLEMLCDWKAATLRHNDGDIRKSIEINQKRFGYSDEMKKILLNTLQYIEQ